MDIRLKEKTSHGNALFPFALYEYDTDTSLKERLYLHWHEEIEFLAVTGGEAIFNIENRAYHVYKGDLIFVNSDFLHSASGIDNKPFNFLAVVFNSALLSSYSNDIIEQKYIDPVLRGSKIFAEHIKPDNEWQKEIIDKINNIKEIFKNKDKAYELKIKTLLLEVWGLLYVNSKSSGEVCVNSCSYKIKRIKLILSYIHKNYNKEISIKELSAVFNMSEGQLCRFFKSMVKMSIVNYINYYRINESAEMLKITDKSIGEIAGEVGFNNISYYNRTFKKYMHCSPSQFRTFL